jgi:hypothetical protein
VIDSNGTNPNLIEKKSFEEDMEDIDSMDSLDASDDLDEDLDEELDEAAEDAFGGEALSAEALEAQAGAAATVGTLTEEEEDLNLDEIDNILELTEDKYPKFTLAKNKARFLRMVSWYRAKEEWIEVAPLSGVTKLFKQQTKELEGIRSSKLDYEMELETGTLTPSQRSYRRDELKMCRVQEKMAVHLISKLQVKIKSGRR